MATLPEKSFQGQPLLEKNNQVQKIQIILGQKIPAAIQWFDEKKTLCLNVKFESKSSADKNIIYISKPKKNCQNAASRFCDYIIISRGCSSHFLDIWIRTNPLLSAGKKTCRKPCFSNFLLLLVEPPCIFFWLEDSVIHLVKSRDWLESKIVLYYGICGPFFNNFQISCQWLFFGAE